MTDRKQWNRMVKGGEGLTVELKLQAPKLDRISRSFSAFSNSAGGYMFFGVKDNGEVVGLEHVKGTADLVKQVANFYCNPIIDIETHVWEYLPGIEVLVVYVPESEIKPVNAVNPNNAKDTWPFFRSDKENLALDKKSIKTMRRIQSVDIEEDVANLDRHTIHILNRLADSPRQTVNHLAKSTNIGVQRTKKIVVHLERNGWIHSFFNEKRREYSLTIPWKKR